MFASLSQISESLSFVQNTTLNSTTFLSISEKLLKEDIEMDELKTALDHFRELLISASKLDFDAAVNTENLQLPTGTAIGPKWAGLCVNDLVRTQKFMQGLFQAVNTVRERKPDEVVTILYAGTGPFATLALPLVSKFSSQELQFVFLEANEVSIKALRNVLQELNLLDYVKEMYHCDAANFNYSTFNQEIDILLVECLQHALAREPQVAITYNLLPQLPEDVVLIPQEISLSLGYYNTKKKEENMTKVQLDPEDLHYTIGASVFQCSKETVVNDKNNERGQPIVFDPVEVEVVEADWEANNMAMIATEIKIFEDQLLTMEQSGLTIPLFIADISKREAPKGLRAKYHVGLEPRLETEFLT